MSVNPPHAEPPNSYRDARRRAGLTQVAAAKALNVRPATVIAWERGEHAPQPDTLAKIAELYGVDAATLTVGAAGVTAVATPSETDNPIFWLGYLEATNRVVGHVATLLSTVQTMTATAHEQLTAMLAQRGHWLAAVSPQPLTPLTPDEERAEAAAKAEVDRRLADLAARRRARGG